MLMQGQGRALGEAFQFNLIRSQSWAILCGRWTEVTLLNWSGFCPHEMFIAAMTRDGIRWIQSLPHNQCFFIKDFILVFMGRYEGFFFHEIQLIFFNITIMRLVLLLGKKCSRFCVSKFCIACLWVWVDMRMVQRVIEDCCSYVMWVNRPSCSSAYMLHTRKICISMKAVNTSEKLLMIIKWLL